MVAKSVRQTGRSSVPQWVQIVSITRDEVEYRNGYESVQQTGQNGRTQYRKRIRHKLAYGVLLSVHYLWLRYEHGQHLWRVIACIFSF